MILIPQEKARASQVRRLNFAVVPEPDFVVPECRALCRCWQENPDGAGSFSYSWWTAALRVGSRYYSIWDITPLSLPPSVSLPFSIPLSFLPQTPFPFSFLALFLSSFTPFSSPFTFCPLRKCLTRMESPRLVLKACIQATLPPQPPEHLVLLL